jgi:hypothetical protein
MGQRVESDMRVHDFTLPETLQALIQKGMWTPTGSQPGGMINLGKGSARKLSQEDDQLVLMPPPFHTIADEVREGHYRWNKVSPIWARLITPRL